MHLHYWGHLETDLKSGIIFNLSITQYALYTMCPLNKYAIKQAGEVNQTDGWNPACEMDW